jgi:hypothetical protein
MSASTSTAASIQTRRDKFQANFGGIWDRFHSTGQLYLESTVVTMEGYLEYSDIFKFKRGTQLVDDRIVLIEVSSCPHEAVAETLNHIVGRTYDLLPGGDLMSLGSSSTQPPLKSNK